MRWSTARDRPRPFSTRSTTSRACLLTTEPPARPATIREMLESREEAVMAATIMETLVPITEPPSLTMELNKQVVEAAAGAAFQVLQDPVELLVSRQNPTVYRDVFRQARTSWKTWRSRPSRKPRSPSTDSLSPNDSATLQSENLPSFQVMKRL